MFAFLLQLRRRLTIRSGDTLRLLSAWLLLMMAAHILAMMVLEGMSFGEALWLTLVTATTVGYGDLSAATPAGRLATVAFMFVGTIFVLATMASLLFERAAERRDLKLRGRWKWKLSMHLLIVSTTGREPTSYLQSLAAQLRRDTRWADCPILLVTHAYDAAGLPPELRALDIVHYSGDGDTSDELIAAGLTDASLLVVLGDSREAKADAYVFDVVSRARSLGYAGPLVAECADDRNRARLCGGPGDVAIRPIRAYPEMLARAIIAPGSERLIEELFTTEGNECRAVAFTEQRQARWRDVVLRLVEADLGTPIGLKLGPAIRTAPAGSETVAFDTLYVVMAQSGQDARVRDIHALFAAAG